LQKNRKRSCFPDPPRFFHSKVNLLRVALVNFFCGSFAIRRSA
jgi:hypothetical protein